LLARSERYVAIDERETHHPFLDRLFFDPARYSFELQLNFMLQRCLLVKRWTDSGTSLVMERSHAEDPVFIRFLLEMGLVTSTQHDVYMEVWSQLDEVTPLPDQLIALVVSPGESIRRLLKAEAASERPVEFPDEATRSAWVTGWARHYQRRFAELNEDPRYATRLTIMTDIMGPDDLATQIIADLEGKLTHQ
jgi:deoxyadenosine/deoxycytidine kinase